MLPWWHTPTVEGAGYANMPLLYIQTVEWQEKHVSPPGHNVEGRAPLGAEFHEIFYTR